MASALVAWTLPAGQDLLKVVEYLAEKSPSAAENTTHPQKMDLDQIRRASLDFEPPALILLATVSSQLVGGRNDLDDGDKIDSYRLIAHISIHSKNLLKLAD